MTSITAGSAAHEQPLQWRQRPRRGVRSASGRGQGYLLDPRHSPTRARGHSSVRSGQHRGATAACGESGPRHAAGCRLRARPQRGGERPGARREGCDRRGRKIPALWPMPFCMALFRGCCGPFRGSHGICGACTGWWQPEESAGLLSRLVFSYCNGILKLGSHKILVQDDLWDVSR